MDLPGGDLETGKLNPEVKDNEVVANGAVVSENDRATKKKSPPIDQHRFTKLDEMESLQRQPSRSSLASVKSRIMVKTLKVLQLLLTIIILEICPRRH